MRTVIVLASIMRMSIKREAQYPLAMILSLLTSFMMFGADFVLIYVLAQKIGLINGWTPERLAIMYVATMVAGAMEMTFTWTLRWFSTDIINGRLDTRLLRPLPTLLIYMGEIILDAFVILFFCAGIIAFIFSRALHDWSVPSILLFLVSVGGGSLILCSIPIFSAALSFWIYDSDIVYRLLREGTRQLLWYPLDIYGWGVRILLTFIIPLAFVGYMPTLALSGETPPDLPSWTTYLSLPVGVVCCAIAVSLWHIGLRRYESTGS